MKDIVRLELKRPRLLAEKSLPEQPGRDVSLRLVALFLDCGVVYGQGRLRGVVLLS
jgi:hypothetical protein